MEISINEFLADPLATEDNCFNFFDWFCRDEALKNRMLSLKGKVSSLLSPVSLTATHITWSLKTTARLMAIFTTIFVSHVLKTMDTFAGSHLNWVMTILI